MAYILIDATDYATLTGRAGSECTEPREAMACALVDSILGRNSITVTTWTTDQTSALEYAVAIMVKYLFINTDSPPDTKGFRLGKYENKGSGTISMNELFFAYMRLKSKGCINWRVYFGAFSAEYV